jgi:surface antigen
MPSPQELLPEQTFQKTREICEQNGWAQFVQRSRQVVGRVALTLGLMTGGGSAIAMSEMLANPELADGDEFVSDYPSLNANPYNAGAYEWWIDENGNGKADIPGELQSARGYYYRNCTDGVAYWASKHMEVNVSGWGNAKEWDDRASNAGYSIKNGNTNDVEPGDIIQSDYGNWGHVGFVTGVNKNSAGSVVSVTVAEMNKSGTGEYTHTTYQSRNSAGNFIRYGSADWDNFIDLTGNYSNSAGKGSALNNKRGLNDVLDATGDPSLGWRTSLSGKTSWQYDYLDTSRAKETLLLGDFDHDDYEDDLLDTTGDPNLGWRVSNGGKSGWDYNYANSSRSANTILVGDFDRDSFKDDLLDTTGDSSLGWRVSANGKSGWDYSFMNSSRQKGTLLVGDFDGDGFENDLLDTTGDPNLGWRVSKGGNSSWDYGFANSSRTAQTLLIGDFDNDGQKDDLLDATGDSSLGWRVSYGGKSGWDYAFRDSSVVATDLAVGDFDGDGYQDDILNAAGQGVGWRVSYDGKSSWDYAYSDSSRAMSSLIIGDFSEL